MKPAVQKVKTETKISLVIKKYLLLYRVIYEDGVSDWLGFSVRDTEETALKDREYVIPNQGIETQFVVAEIELPI